MQPGFADSPAYLDQWIEDQEADRSKLNRVLDGLEITLRGGTRDETGSGQEPNFFLPGLTETPWWDSEAFPWLAGLETATEDIASEFEDLGGLTPKRIASRQGLLAEGGRWSTHYLYNRCRAHSRNLDACPQTVQALRPAPGALGCGMTYFSVLDPGTHIAAHTGFTNAHLRCHLGLVTPSGARIRVGDEIRNWQRGKAFVFDDSFEHEAWNETDQGRAVLLFDIWHPELTEIETRAISYLMNVWRKLAQRTHLAQEFASR